MTVKTCNFYPQMLMKSLISHVFSYNSVVTDLRLYSLIFIIIVVVYDNWYF